MSRLAGNGGWRVNRRAVEQSRGKSASLGRGCREPESIEGNEREYVGIVRLAWQTVSESARMSKGGKSSSHIARALVSKYPLDRLTEQAC